LKKLIQWVLTLAVLYSCNNEKSEDTTTKKIFPQLSSNDTGMEFKNILTENDSLNYSTNGYIYMGGSVSAGDINNDVLIELYLTGNLVPTSSFKQRKTKV
jgi:hypothetical protein